MLKKTIKYTDYNGVEREEDFFFNLNKAEITEMEVSAVGGLSTVIKKMVATQNVPEIMKLFKSIILKSYGEKSDDGKRFVKNEQMAEEFTQTEAYVELYTELISDADKMADFIEAIVPAEAAAQAKKGRDNIKKIEK